MSRCDIGIYLYACADVSVFRSNGIDAGKPMRTVMLATNSLIQLFTRILVHAQTTITNGMSDLLWFCLLPRRLGACGSYRTRTATTTSFGVAINVFHLVWSASLARCARLADRTRRTWVHQGID